MGFGLAQRARSRKAKAGLRALLGRAPDAAEVGDRLTRLARRVLGAAVLDATPRRLTIQLHPAASPATLAVLPDGDLELRGETSTLGPGYHAEVLARVGTLVDELDHVWDGEVPDLATLQLQMGRWLADELRAGATRIGMPAERTFHVDAAVQTAMGPRDAAWRDRVLADPRVASDAFPWWDRGPGQLERSRALHAMWHEVPWREPLDEAELALLRSVDDDLRAARKLDRALAVPWPEWAELLDWLGEDERCVKARQRAGDAPSAIGYRRYPMDVAMPGDWATVLPGAFVAHEEDDGRWWATDGDRAVEMTCFMAGDDLSSAQLLAIAPEVHPVRERFVDGARHGRLEVHDEGAIHIRHGLVAHAPHVAILTCKSHDPDDAWALAAWRGLHQPQK